jgi:tight adherence protein C
VTWPAVLLAAVWVALVVVRGVEHRPVSRLLVLSPQPARRSRSNLGEPSERRRASAMSPRRGVALLTAAAAVVGLMTMGPLGAGLAAVSVPVLARVRTKRATRARHAVRRARLPDAVDLLVVAGSAGLASRQAMALVAQRGPPELRTAFAEAVARAGAGEPWAQAVLRLIDTIGEPARPIVHAIVAAEQDGAPMATVLSRLAGDARRQRRHDLEAAMRRLPVRLSFPLVCCSLPAFVLLTVVPLVAAGLRRLGPVAL